MTIGRFEDVVAWQKGRELNKLLFRVLQNNKNFSFKDQMFRASLSITNNIAEGFERGGDKELRQFLIVARGSAAEVRSMLYTALD
ncbi:four helix bundle protein, partial [Candidatus Saccharibacteria bacterium]|nr:four helix bundle protein [Candidatus Saccharibacteria bacterium]